MSGERKRRWLSVMSRFRGYLDTAKRTKHPAFIAEAERCLAKIEAALSHSDPFLEGGDINTLVYAAIEGMAAIQERYQRPSAKSIDLVTEIYREILRFNYPHLYCHPEQFWDGDWAWCATDKLALVLTGYLERPVPAATTASPPVRVRVRVSDAPAYATELAIAEVKIDHLRQGGFIRSASYVQEILNQAELTADLCDLAASLAELLQDGQFEHAPAIAKAKLLPTCPDALQEAGNAVATLWEATGTLYGNAATGKGERLARLRNPNLGVVLAAFEDHQWYRQTGTSILGTQLQRDLSLNKAVGQ